MASRNNKNKGYSLVEMIIVLAIIGVVSGMALVTVTLIHSAKVKDASVVFDSEVSELLAKAKSMNDSSGMYAIRVYKDDKNNFYIQSGTVKKSGSNYKFKISPDNPNDYKGQAMSKYARISFTQESNTGITYPDEWNNSFDSVWTSNTNIVVDGAIGSFSDGASLKGVLIIVTKSGDVISGNGSFCFYKRSNGSEVARVYVRKNGSHEAR